MQISLIAVLLLSCKNPCRNNDITPAFIGFSKTDIDTIILTSFKPNDNFREPIEKILVTQLSGSARIYTTINDTTFVFINDSDSKRNISSGLDWQIFIPAKNRTISISNIVSENNEGGKRCTNPIKSFVQDGSLILPQVHITNQFYTSGYMAYIHN